MLGYYHTGRNLSTFIFRHTPCNTPNYRRCNMIKLQKMLQNAEYELRNWGQAYAGNADPLALKKLQLICDKLQIARKVFEASFKWE